MNEARVAHVSLRPCLVPCGQSVYHRIFEGCPARGRLRVSLLPEDRCRYSCRSSCCRRLFSRGPLLRGGPEHARLASGRPVRRPAPSWSSCATTSPTCPPRTGRSALPSALMMHTQDLSESRVSNHRTFVHFHSEMPFQSSKLRSILTPSTRNMS
jgi:hypothetical protein